MESRAKILIVDDEPNSLKLLSVLLANFGYDSETAQSGKEAIEKARDNLPDVILLDVIMPEMNGIDVVGKLKESDATRHIPIIITTSHGDTDTRIDCLKAGVNDFLIKPIDAEELRLRLNNILQVKRYEELQVTNRVLQDARGVLEEKNRALEKAYSDLKSAQAQILQQEKMASIGQLAAGIAHEINNPVGYIISNIGSMKKYVERMRSFCEAQAVALEEISRDPQAVKVAMEQLASVRKESKIDLILDDIDNLFIEVLSGSDRVRQIIQDLKLFSYADSDEFRPADINAGLNSTLNVIWNELKYKAEVIKELGDLPLTRCIIGQLNQVFMNLLVNAAHAIETNGKITIRTWSDERDIFISVADTGSGIAPENLSKIFDPFFTTKEIGKGTGLGLSIAYDIIRKHKGEISLQSEPGRGTEFLIRIPVVSN